MSTFLEICQDTASEAGFIDNTTDLVSVVNQSSMLGKTVRWVREAWTDIQREKSHWKFQHGTFNVTLSNGVQIYDATTLNVTRLNRWVTNKKVWIHDKSIGLGDETELKFLPYDEFRARFNYGTSASDTGRPTFYTVEPDNELAFYPTPNAEYGVRGTYYKSAQILTANTDVPDMPEDYHSLIKWCALEKYAGYDEANSQIQYWLSQKKMVKSDLVRDQLQEIKLGGALS